MYRQVAQKPKHSAENLMSVQNQARDPRLPLRPLSSNLSKAIKADPLRSAHRLSVSRILSRIHQKDRQANSQNGTKLKRFKQ